MSDSKQSYSISRSEYLAECPEDERKAHRKFLLRHIDTLINVLAGEQLQRQWMTPIGCPDATPETLARYRSKTGASYTCCYDSIATSTEETRPDEGCICSDPLHGSDEPLDAVAATIISGGTTALYYYFDRSGRAIISELRKQIGSWDAIAEVSLETLEQVSRDAEGRRILDHRTAETLLAALDAIQRHRYTTNETLTLKELPSVAYHHLHEMLESLPGVNSPTAWWLLLTAFDKPVWPVDERLDSILADLGLFNPEVTPENGRDLFLEEVLTDRQLPMLHRALAGHLHYCSGDHATADCELQQFCLTHRLYKQSATEKEQPTVVDLFCGAGGLSLGFTRGVSASAFDVALAVDMEQDATDTYRLNHPEVPHRQIRCEDIGDLAANPEGLEALAPEVDIVVGGPPCQALSVAGYRSRLAADESYSVLKDPRTGLYRHYVSLLETLDPQYIIMENVEGIRSPLDDDGTRVIDRVRDTLSDTGYVTDHRLLDCSEFGIPQRRDRVLLFGVQDDAVPNPRAHVEGFFEDLSFTSSSDTTIRQALANLPRLRRGEGGTVIAKRSPGRASKYLRDNQLNRGTRLTYNHQAREHPMEKDRKLFSEVMEPGDTGWDVKYRTKYGHLIEYDVGTEENPSFKDKYRMLHWDRPSPTIVAHLAKDGNSFILPDYYEYVRSDELRQDSRRSRGITPREAARIQSFPDSYLFLGPFTSQYRQIGNAVPPLLGERIASVVGEYLEDTLTNIIRQPNSIAASTDD